MARELRCADLIPGCDFVAQGKDDSEVMRKVAEHAKSAHRMATISRWATTSRSTSTSSSASQ